MIVVVVLGGLLGAGAGWLVAGRAGRYRARGAVASEVPTVTPARRSTVAVVTAAACMAVTWWMLLLTASGDGATGTILSTMLVTLVFLAFAVVSILLALVDIAVHRLPDDIVLPSAAIAGALLIAACVAGAPWADLGRSAAGALIMFGFYAALRLLSRRGMGGGDVKLAGLIGMHLGWLGWGALVVGLMAAFVLGGLFSLALILARRADRSTAIPFGPWMLAGAWTGIVTGGMLEPLLLGTSA